MSFTDGKLDLKVTNPNSLGTVVGYRALNADGAVLGEPFVTLGYVAGTFYPGFSRLFGPSTGSFPIPLPGGTASVDFVSAAMGLNSGDWANLEPDKPLTADAIDMYAGCVVFSSFIDFFLPMTLLAAGVGGSTATALSKDLIQKMVEKVGVALLIEVGKIVLIDLYDAKHAGITAELIVANLSKIGKAMVAATRSSAGYSRGSRSPPPSLSSPSRPLTW